MRRTLDKMVGPPMVRKTTAPRLATSCHFPKVRALMPNMLPAPQAPHTTEHMQVTTRNSGVTMFQSVSSCWVGGFCCSSEGNLVPLVCVTILLILHDAVHA